MSSATVMRVSLRTEARSGLSRARLFLCSQAAAGRVRHRAVTAKCMQEQQFFIADVGLARPIVNSVSVLAWLVCYLRFNLQITTTMEIMLPIMHYSFNLLHERNFVHILLGLTNLFNHSQC